MYALGARAPLILTSALVESGVASCLGRFSPGERSPDKRPGGTQSWCGRSGRGKMSCPCRDATPDRKGDGEWCKLPYFSIDNARVIYTKKV